MLPIVTPEQMRVIDAAAPEPTDVLIARAGAAVARAAVRLLGGTYGRTVNVIAGRGNNGADGRVAGSRLAAKGVRVRVFDADDCPAVLPPANLVIDAAYGTGFHGSWNPPDAGGAPVLAVDVPSGIDALTGAVAGPVLPAVATVTFGALKPGLLLHPAAALAGTIEIAEIGLGVAAQAAARAHLVQAADVGEWLPRRAPTAHKWNSALRVIAGSQAMAGAAALVARGALRAGAGMVRVSSPGGVLPHLPVEVVQETVDVGIDRCHALVVGPGLGRDADVVALAHRLALAASVPTVIDGDGLFAVATNGVAELRARPASTVLTPHDGEYELLMGARPGVDRIDAARRLASESGCVVLLKGATTVIAEPGDAVSGNALLVTTGDARLASAGTGDVLAGIIGALLAGGVPALHAAAGAAWLHGTAASRAAARGMIASDIAQQLPAVLDTL